MEGRISAPCPQLAPLGRARQDSAVWGGAHEAEAERCALIRARRCSGTSPRGTTLTSPRSSRWSPGAGSGSAREAARLLGCAARARGAGRRQYCQWHGAQGPRRACVAAALCLGASAAGGSELSRLKHPAGWRGCT